MDEMDERSVVLLADLLYVLVPLRSIIAVQINSNEFNLEVKGFSLLEHQDIFYGLLLTPTL